MSLQTEIEVFKRELPRLLAENEGKFALVFDGAILGTYESYADAIQAGYKVAGLTPFLVKKVSSVDEAAHFTRNLVLCQV